MIYSVKLQTDMVITEDFKKFIKCGIEDTKENTLHIWKNDEVDIAKLGQIIRSGEWSKLEYIDGFFAAVYNTPDKVYLICDRLGIYPLFYYTNENAVYASPRIPDILKATKSSLGYSLDGIVSLLMFGHHIADETIFTDIKRCNGGETIVINKEGKTEEKIVWRKTHIYQDKASMNPNELCELFIENVRKMLPADSNVLLSLSGGFDSRAILAALLECMESKRIHTITFGGKDTYDFRIAKLVANKAGVKNVTFPIRDEIFSDSFLRQRADDYSYSYPVFSTQPQDMLNYLSEELSKGNTSFWGVGGDAITGSHLRTSDISLQMCKNPEELARLLIAKRCYLPLIFISNITKLNENEIVEIIARLIDRSPQSQYDKSWQFLDFWDIFVRGRMEIISVLPFYLQSWRCPHLGRDYFRAMSTQCFEGKIRQNAYKSMLSLRFKFLFGLPTRRLRGRSLVGGKCRSFCWVARWRIAKLKRSLAKIAGLTVDGVGRNYGRELRFLNSTDGQKSLYRVTDVLLQKKILHADLNTILQLTRKESRAGSIFFTLGYGFNKQF